MAITPLELDIPKVILALSPTSTPRAGRRTTPLLPLSPNNNNSNTSSSNNHYNNNTPRSSAEAAALLSCTMATFNRNFSNDDDSTLSNDSLMSDDDDDGANSTSSSLDHEARLSNARAGGGGAPRGGGGGGSNGKDDRDMTEDEVAIMVKNALRKARRAMNNSSPASDDGSDDDGKAENVNSDDDNDDDDDSSLEGNNYKPSSKYMDALDSLTPKQSASYVDYGMDTSSHDRDGAADDDDDDDKSTDEGKNKASNSRNDLAKRIEEEIQSARAFAEKKYYGNDEQQQQQQQQTMAASSATTPSPTAKKCSVDDRGMMGISTPKSGGGGTSPLGRNISSPHSANRSTDTEGTPLISNILLSSGGGSGSNNNNSPSPKRGGAAAVDISDLPTPKATSGRSSKSAREQRMSRSKDKIALANEKMLKMQSSPGGGGHPVSPRGNHNNKNMGSPTASSNRPPKDPMSPKTTGKSEFDALLAVSPSNVPRVPSTVVARSPVGADASSITFNNNSISSSYDAGNKSLNVSTDTPINAADYDDNNKSWPHNALTPNTKILNSSSLLNSSIDSHSSDVVTPLNTNKLPPLCQTPNTSTMMPPPPPNTNSNKPREHRQVLFRHPYPLPPPPPLPRGDAIIVSSHSAPDKNINTKWVQPDQDLKALIEAAGEEYNLVRRSNACGALKVLASKDSNKPKLCRTRGLLDVLVKASWDDAVDSDALDARTRAVTTILYLSEPKDNRLIVAKHKQILQVLVKVIEEDTGEARWRASSALATLAKTPGNRGGMGRVDKLTAVLGELMVVGQQGKEEPATKKDKKKQGENHDGINGNGDGKENDMGESREDDSTFMHGGDSSTRPSFDTMDDERMLTHTYTGTFTDGTGTTYSGDMTYQSAYDSDTHGSDMEKSDDEDEGEGTDGEGEDGSHEGSVEYPSDFDEGSVQEEEGVEMQISSLKKLNIENASDFLAKSQLSACATLTHLTKHCANAPSMCTNEPLLQNIIFLAGIFDSPLHTRCIEILCNFTRFPSNNARLASMPVAIETLLICGKSKIPEDRMWSVRTIQNLCSDASSKVGLATGAMLSLLSTAAMRKDYEEQFAAVGALMNLSTEPGSIVPLTNTKTVVATLVHLAHSPNTPGAVRKIACDSLATIGLWLQTLASAGTVPEEIPFSPLPTHSATGWLRWDN